VAVIEVKGQKSGGAMVVTPIIDDIGESSGAGRVERWVTTADPNTQEEETLATVRVPAIINAMPEHLHQSRTVRAMLNSRDNAAPLIGIVANRARELAIPAPECDVDLTIEHALTLQAGALVKLTDTTQHNPPNPLSTSRGWSGVMARLLNVRVSPSSMEVQLRVALLSERGQSALVAPAALVSSKGTHAGGAEYFAVGDDDFTISTIDDWGGFVVGDLIELRSITGALKEAETIESFGANEAATPAAASTSTVNVVGAIASSIVAGDYITFAPWVTATVTTNMEKHAGQAGTDDLIDADAARVWV